MGVFDYKFRSSKMDQSPYLFHFTKGTVNEAKNALYSILEEKIIRSKTKDYTCFTASPITSLHQFFETKVNRTNEPLYQPFGIGFSRDILVGKYKARNVIYGDAEDLALLPNEYKWRTELLNIDNHDFEYLREWRIKGSEFDFSSFPAEHILVIAPHLDDVNDLVAGHDIEYAPIVNFYTGDVEPDFKEVFPRKYKGLPLDTIRKDCKDDFQVSGATVSQTLEEDMFSTIIEGFGVYAERQSKK